MPIGIGGGGSVPRDIRQSAMSRSRIRYRQMKRGMFLTYYLLNRLLGCLGFLRVILIPDVPSRQLPAMSSAMVIVIVISFALACCLLLLSIVPS